MSCALTHLVSVVTEELALDEARSKRLFRVLGAVLSTEHGTNLLMELAPRLIFLMCSLHQIFSPQGEKYAELSHHIQKLKVLSSGCPLDAYAQELLDIYKEQTDGET